jgi:hypothetical protein
MNSQAKKLGYYSVGNYHTFQKFLAIQENKRTSAGVKWHFNDDKLLQHDWTSPSGTGLPELYRRRAEQLRNDYDYLVIFYSGGSDSQTILDTFLTHGLHIDEIATCWSLKGAKSNVAYFNEEIHQVALPYVKSIEHQIPHTKFRLIDQTDLILADFKSSLWFLDHANFLTPNCVTRSKLRETVVEYQQLINQGKKVGFIWGRDKPHILTDENGIIYTQFNDYVDNNTSAYSQMHAEQGWYDEFFYQAPETAEIMITQCHTVINRLREKSIDSIFFQDQQTSHGCCPYTGKYLTSTGLSHLLYPGWNPHTFSNGKNVSNCWGQRDDWFFQRCTHTQAYRNWLEGVNHIFNYYYLDDQQKSWLNGDSIFDNVKGVLGPRFDLCRRWVD